MRGKTAMILVIIILCIFLAAAVCVVVGFAFRVHTIRGEYEKLSEYTEHIENKLEVQTNLNRDLKREKAVLYVENNHLRAKAQELTELNELRAKVQELIELNKALSAPAEPVAVPAVNPKERLPEGVATNRYDCEGHEFPAGTEQAKLQKMCYTSQIGMRIFDGDDLYFCVALGNAYGTDIGDAWRVTLRNGSVFKIIRADYQHDISDPDPDDFGERYEYDKSGNVVGLLRNYDGKECVHVLEFIVDLEMLPQEAKEAGGMHGLEFFGGKFGDGGNIVKFEYLGRKWKP